MKSNAVYTFLFLSLLFVRCGKKEVEVEKIDHSSLKYQVLKDLSTSVIVETYNDLAASSGEFLKSIEALKENPTQENMENVRKKWIALRIPWETSEGFLYGPADTQSLDPALDSWPVDINAMEAIVNEPNKAITPTLLAEKDEARGFHLIEFLLWGEDGQAKITDLSPRKLEYMLAAAQDLDNNIKELYNAWRADSGNYVRNFIDVASGVYANPNTALEEIIGGIASICDEVGNTKIAVPLNQEEGVPKPEEEESRFSNNSKTDFKNNIQSVKNIYYGTYKTLSGKGLTDLVRLKNTELDAKVKNQIELALSSIENINGTFSEAIKNNRQGVLSSIETINTLWNTLIKEVNPLIKEI